MPETTPGETTAADEQSASDATGRAASGGADRATSGGAGRAASGIGLSRLSGVIRAVLVTNVLGVSAVGDAFAAALRIPNMLQNLLGEGALSAAFVPSYANLTQRDRAAAGQLAAAVASFLFAIATVAVLIAVVAARPITRLIAWGFEGERFELAVKLVRITAIGAGVLVIGAWCVCILNTQRRFFSSYVAPVLWNIAQISVLLLAVWLGWKTQDAATALAWAVTVGAVAQVLFLLVVVRRADSYIFGSGSTTARQRRGVWHRLSWRRLSWRQAEVRTVLRRLAPAVAGRGAFQISAFIDLALASLLAVGATAALAAAQALYLLPVALIGISVAAVELPALSRLSDEVEIARRTAARVASTTYLVCGVVAIYLAAGVPLADSLFNLAGLRNAVGQDDVFLIATILGAYSLGLPAIVASRLYQNVLFAAGDTKSPARAALVRVSCSAIVGVVLMFPFDHLLVLNGSYTGFANLGFNSFAMLNDAVRLDPVLPARLGAVGLAVGASIGAWVELYLLRSRSLGRSAPEPSALEPSAPAPSPQQSALARHIFPAVVALVVGILTAQFLSRIDDLASIVRLIVITAAVSGVHLGLGLVLKLPAARQLTSLGKGDIE